MKTLAVACGALLTLLAGSCSSTPSPTPADAGTPPPTAAVDSYPYAYANAVCYFMFHCCTPADRANPNGFGFLNVEQQDDFENEADCDSRYGAATEAGFQLDQDAVAEKRMSYNQPSAQACLTALDNAAGSCDPVAFSNSSLAGGVCDSTLFYTGLVSNGASCAQDGECASQGSVCSIPTEANNVPVVTSVGSCGPPPAAGAACTNDCAAGSCCGSDDSTCAAYAAEGAECQPSNIFEVCPEQPSGCDPSKDYCNVPATSEDGTGNCAALVANGGACDPSNDGAECQSTNCDSTSSTCTVPPTPKLDICTGNPSGL